MITINVNVTNKIATASTRVAIVCGNSGYQIKFTFDSEWNEHDAKTARFIWNGRFVDVAFTGDTCPVPIISNTNALKVGVYAGELTTTTPAHLDCLRSILCGGEKLQDEPSNGEAQVDAVRDAGAQVLADIANARKEASGIEDAIRDAGDQVLDDIADARKEAINNIDTETLDLVLRAALKEAKESGEFDGQGITSITRVEGNGAAGTVDTYEILFSGGTTTRYSVYNGADGTPITITNVTESAVEGGDNTVTFSDGTTLTVKNGTPGPKGDPFTYADFTEEQLEALKGKSVTITKVQTGVAYQGKTGSLLTFSDGTTLFVQHGSDGVGISKIEKTETNGRVDTYTITLTNGATYPFTVTNSNVGDLSELFTVDKVATVDTYANGATNIMAANNGVTWRDVMSFSDGADFTQEATALFKVPFIAGKNIAFEIDGEVVKINLAEVINNLTTNSTDKPLSAAQGVALKALIDALPSWAKEANKPSYSPSEVGAVPTSRTVNGKALSSNIALSASNVGADASGTASSAIASHNTNVAAHYDIRVLIDGLTTRLNALANSTDEDLDQMAEVVAYIKANKELIDSITTSKVSVADIVNNLTSNVTNKPLSAAQGVALKALIDAITVPTKVSQLTNDSGFLTQHQDLSAYAKTANHYTKTESDNKYQAKGNYLTAVPSEYVTETELNDKGYLTSHQDISGKADKSSAETWTFKLKDGTEIIKKVVLV